MLNKEEEGELRKQGYSEQAIKDIKDYNRYCDSPLYKLIESVCESREAEKFAEQLLNDRKDWEKDNKEFNNLLLWGTTHPELEPNTFINLGNEVIFGRFTKEEIIEKYSHLLTEEEKKKLLEDPDNNKP